LPPLPIPAVFIRGFFICVLIRRYFFCIWGVTARAFPTPPLIV
jgi:hypothetical protein